VGSKKPSKGKALRIRTVKPEFFTHESLYDAEAIARLPLRLSFIGLWCAADREGRFKWEPRRLGVQILPYDQIDFSRVLDALATRGFIVRYSSLEGDFGYIPSFTRHQVINNRERESDLPNPNDCNEFDACLTRASRDDHAGKAEGKGKEQGKEGKGNEKAVAITLSRGTLEELRNYALEIGQTTLDGESMFHHWESNGWKNGSNPVKNWKAGIQKWKQNGWLPSQKDGKGNLKPKGATPDGFGV